MAEILAEYVSYKGLSLVNIILMIRRPPKVAWMVYTHNTLPRSIMITIRMPSHHLQSRDHALTETVFRRWTQYLTADATPLTFAALGMARQKGSLQSS